MSIAQEQRLKKVEAQVAELLIVVDVLADNISLLVEQMNKPKRKPKNAK